MRSLYPLYRGISVITPLPFGEGKGEGPAGAGGCAVAVITPLSIRRGAGGEAKRASSSFENMPFLHAEDALLEARRASSTTLFVIA
ncbi:hypothetical protein AXF23_03400 [Prevotella sp. oral taxon 313]|nr:hypothetical protein AXF23_03400 [Prevotella sp. oral taxon 313]